MSWEGGRIESINREQPTINKRGYKKYMIMQQKGFTLVEILVVMAMTAIMISVTLISLGGTRDQKAVEGETRKFAATVRELQNYALTGRQIVAGQVSCAIGIFSMDSGDDSYIPSYSHRTGTTCADAPEFIELSPSGLSGGVSFETVPADALYFRVPRGDLIDRSGAPITTAQLIVLNKNTASYSVCVYPSGMITETAGALGSCP